MDDFKPVVFSRKRKRKEKTHIDSKVCKNSNSSSKSKSTSDVSKKSVSPNASKRPTNVWCPICQFRFVGKFSKGSFHHIENCVGARESAEECPDGELCVEKDLDHYIEFSHYKLGLFRSYSTSEAIKVEQNQDLAARKQLEGHIQQKISNISELVKVEEGCLDSNVPTHSEVFVAEQDISHIPCNSFHLPKNIMCSLKGHIIYHNDVVVAKNISVKQGKLSVSCDCFKDSVDKSGDYQSEVDVKFSSKEMHEDLILSWINNPVELDVTYNNYGLKKICISCPSEFDVTYFQLLVGNCCHFGELKCIIGKNETLPDSYIKTLKRTVVVDFASLGFNCDSSPEKVISQKLSLDYTEHDCVEDKIVDLQNSCVYLEDNILPDTPNGSDPCLENKCNLNSSFENYCLDNDDNEEDNDVIIETIDTKNDSKEKWKSIFKKKSPTEVPSLPQQSDYRNDRKKCPFYKRIPGTSFTVDAFQYGVIQGVTHYFLTHFHADHYGGLTKRFQQKIICSNVTASLVAKKLCVEPKYLHVVRCTETFALEGVIITPLDANHCPGSLMFLFQLKSGKCYLHVGDFRASTEMQLYPAFSNINVDVLFLDTTYCNPQYEFPSQNEVVQGVIRISKRYLRLEPATLIVSGTYTIGKEKVFIGIADALGSNIWAPKPKLEVLKRLHDKFIDSKLVEYPCKARVHIWPMTKLNHFELEQHLKDCSQAFKRILAFSPSGWNFKKKCSIDDAPAATRGRVTIIGVPYSEHSSYSELREFVKFLRPTKVVPTVAPKNISFPVVSQCCNKWLTERDEKPVPERQQKITNFLMSNSC